MPMSSRSRSTGFSERSSTDSPTLVELFSWSEHDLPPLSSTPRSRSLNGMDKMNLRPGPTSLNLRFLSLLNLPTTGLFSHPGPTDPQCRWEQESWWRQTQTVSILGTLGSLF